MKNTSLRDERNHVVADPPEEHIGAPSPHSYCGTRLAALDISDEENLFCEQSNYRTFEVQDPDDIRIRYMNLNGSLMEYLPEGSRSHRGYRRTRFKIPIVDEKTGKTIKYQSPSNTPSRPFFNGIVKFFPTGDINTLFITEGEIKAFAGCKNGIPTIGISGIHNFGYTIKNESGKTVVVLPLPELKEFIESRYVRNLVFLHDADATANHGKPERLKSFNASIENFLRAFTGLGVSLHYAHIHEIYANSAKGLDDLISSSKSSISDIQSEAFGLKGKRFFRFFDLQATSLDKIKRYFYSKAPDTKEEKEKNTIGHQFENIFKYLSENHQIVKNKVTELLEDDGKELTDAGINSLYIKLSKHHEVTKANFDIAINSEDIPHYNPIHDFFHKHAHMHPAGNIEKLISCLDVITGFRDGDFAPLYANSFIKKWLVGLVAGAFDKNYNPLMIVLISKPNTGKTYFFRHLLPKELESYFAESKFSEGKDDSALMCSKLLILNDELAFSSNMEARNFRNFISADAYSYRPPYARSNITKKRLASVCGTCNDRDIIKDPDNNRRIIPIEINGIDHALYNSIDKTELLMEAYHLYKSGFDWNLTQAEIATLLDNTRDYVSVVVERDLISKTFRVPTPSDMPVKKSVGEIVAEIHRLFGIRGNAVVVGKCLSELGFMQKTVKVPGTKTTERKYLVCYNNEQDIHPISS